MSKLILTGLVAAAALGVAGCGGGAGNNVATENVEDLNAAEPMDDMNMDMNATDNATDEATGNATGNEATENKAY